jgi:hypothetical protein
MKTEQNLHAVLPPKQRKFWYLCLLQTPYKKYGKSVIEVLEMTVCWWFREPQPPNSVDWSIKNISAKILVLLERF